MPLKLSCVLCLVMLLATAAIAQEKLPADLAGKIGPVSGSLAFIRGGDVWTINIGSGLTDKVCEITNADGRLSWSPDNKKIAFTRSGTVDVQGPDLLGGRHKVYDIYLAFIDSAYANNRLYWYKLTDDMGSRDPEWSRDGNRIAFWKDLNANRVNAGIPNYQPCMMGPDGSEMKILRKDWQSLEEEGTYLISPSISSQGDLAAVYFANQTPKGVVVLRLDSVMTDMSRISEQALTNSDLVAPAWSPDGRFVACVSRNMNAPGVFLLDPKTGKRYLVWTPPPSMDLFTMAPSFSPDGTWLTFATTDGSVWICDITGNGARRITGPGQDRSPAWSK